MSADFVLPALIVVAVLAWLCHSDVRAIQDRRRAQAQAPVVIVLAPDPNDPTVPAGPTDQRAVTRADVAVLRHLGQTGQLGQFGQSTSADLPHPRRDPLS